MPANGHNQERRHTVHITFNQPFSTVPWINVAIMSLDESSHANIRVDSGAANIQTNGFDLFAREWQDTTMYGVTLAWIACTV